PGQRGAPGQLVAPGEPARAGPATQPPERRGRADAGAVVEVARAANPAPGPRPGPGRAGGAAHLGDGRPPRPVGGVAEKRSGQTTKHTKTRHTRKKTEERRQG